MAKDRQIKLSVTEEMFQELTERAERMSISVPALCCYFIGEKLDHLKMTEKATLQKFDNISIQDLFSNFFQNQQQLTPEQIEMFKLGVRKGIDFSENSDASNFLGKQGKI